MTTILDPTDERKPVTRQITARAGTLSGTVGLLDIRKPRGNVLLDELERQLAGRGARHCGEALYKADLYQTVP